MCDAIQRNAIRCNAGCWGAVPYSSHRASVNAESGAATITLPKSCAGSLGQSTPRKVLPPSASCGRCYLFLYQVPGIHYVCINVFFAHRHVFVFRPGLFSCSRPRGTQGIRPNTTAHVWALAEVRDTCSGGSKSRKLASNHG